MATKTKWRTAKWNDRIVAVIKEANRPLLRREIAEKIETSFNSIGVYLYNAKMDGVIAHIKIDPMKVGYYCNPEWLDKNGKLKEEYKVVPYWDKPPKPKIKVKFYEPNQD